MKISLPIPGGRKINLFISLQQSILIQHLPRTELPLIHTLILIVFSPAAAGMSNLQQI
jgi:hypothetical protein